jgi:transketolase
LQIDGFTGDIKNLEPLADKWRSFNWHVLEVDGHNLKELMSALDKAESLKSKPTVIIAHTIKGKGISFMENKVEWHGVAPKKEELERALKELEQEEAKI